MRRLLPLLAALAAAVPLAAGCGGDEDISVSAAEAAAATRDADAAKITMTAKVTGLGSPLPVNIKGTGVTATSEPRMDMTFDLGTLLALAGASGDGKTRVLADGGRVYVDPPAVQGVNLPGGARWVTADVARVLQGLGIDASGLGELMRLSPDQQLAALQATGSVKEVGEEEIDGERTVHLRGTIKPSDYLKVLPADRRAAAEKALKELDRLGDGPSLDQATPVDMWIGEDKLLRRMVQKTEIPAQQGVPGGALEIRMDLSEYGTKLDVAAPTGDAVYDATKAIEQALENAPAGITTG